MSVSSRLPSVPAPLFLEPLEERIAPAVFLVGQGPGAINYDDAPFVRADQSTDPGIAALFQGSDDHYYLSLAPRDAVNIYSGGTPNEFITLQTGRVIAFFFDANQDSIVQRGELSGFSFSDGLSLRVNGSVDGDIVGNLDGRTGLLSFNDLTVATNSVRSLAVNGDIFGDVIAAGNLTGLNLKSVESITTKSSGGFVYDFGGTGAGPGIGEASLNAYVPANNRPGGSISNVNVGVVQSIEAGDGGAGGAGGSISNLTITSSPGGFLVAAGSGGDGNRGGAGGRISNVLVTGVGEFVPSVDLISIQGGDGGDSLGNAGPGGAGGAVSSINVGYLLSGRNLVDSPVGDQVSIMGGEGGDGRNGGAGGAVSAVQVLSNTNDGVAAAYEISVVAGDGGAGVARDGNGGALSNVTLRNNSLILPDHDSILVQSGSAGSGSAGFGVGGAISNVTVLGDFVQVRAGDGADGARVGGAGGSISRLSLDATQVERVSLFDIRAGNGGDTLAGRAGVGGSISFVTGLLVDLQQVGTLGNSSVLAAGNGGDNAGGRAAAGGSISSTRIFEPIQNPGAAFLNVAAGDGGEGTAAGGLGGSIMSFTFVGYATSVQISGGAGGDATLSGAGGAGGRLMNLVARSELSNFSSPTVNISSGAGGDAAGSNGRAGAGGAFTNATLIFGSNVVASSGAGGAGGTSAASFVGAGGAISGVSVISETGSATLAAGNAGTPLQAGRGAVGGGIQNSLVVAQNNILVTAGDGSAGGAGGSISRLVWYGTSFGSNQVSGAPLGSVQVLAGEGSTGPSTSGRGGDLRNLAGFASQNTAQTTQIFAGDGNGGASGVRGSVGGTIDRVDLYGGVSPVDIRAGNGGGVVAGGRGVAGAGGSVSNINAGTEVFVKVLAAGNGGDNALANGRAGLGGSINNVAVFGDIGERQSQVFGINTMGGVFAGAGGTSQNSALNASAGNVVNLVAKAVSSIVAGRPESTNPENFQLVQRVDRIFLRGLDVPTVESNGAFNLVPLGPGTNTAGFYQANLVGGVAGLPEAAGANIFKIEVAGVPVNVAGEYTEWNLGVTKPVDGFIAAHTMTQAKNFIPEAFLTSVPTSVFPTGYALADYRNNFTTFN